MASSYVTALVLAAVAIETGLAATSNVTYEPRHPLPGWVSARNEALVLATGKNTGKNGSDHDARRSDIRELIRRLTQEEAEKFARELSGESSLILNRVTTNVGPLHPFGVDMAVKYVEDKMLGFGFEVNLHAYREGYAPNVISCLRGTETPEQIVIMGAHLDDIPSTGRAPGANDDGSGSAALLAAAQAISLHKARFKKSLCLEHYTGEEQGLVGSRAQAALRKARGDDVVAMLQQDMTAVHLANDDTGLAFVTDPRASDPDLTQVVKNIGREYGDPELVLHDAVLSGSSCCSDHQSYAEQGYPAVGMIEPRGYTGDPQYHRAGDLVDRAEYDTAQLAYAAQVALAAAAQLAGITI